MLKGIDISYCQAGLSIPDTGADFCFIKATEGLNIVDDYCDGFVQQCIALGKPWGFYHFARPNGGAAEARYFYNNTKNYTGCGIPVLDFEDERNDNNYIDEFVKEYHAITGIYPLIYMNSNFVNNYGYGSDYVKQNCGLWLAGYPNLRTDYPDDANCPYQHNGWTLAAWQFTNNLYVAGMHVDGDFFYGDTNAWNLYASGGKSSVSQSAPTPSQPVQAAPETFQYTVVSGDTLSGIAARYGITYQELARINGIPDPDTIYPGQVLNISDNGASGVAPTYTVVSGDTLSGIAARFGTTYQELARINGIPDPDTIYPGQVLRIG